MQKLIPVLPRPLRDRRWLPPTRYTAAAAHEVVPLTANEMPQAALHHVLAFVRTGSTLAPFAVFGLEPGHNLFVGADGSWQGGYLPQLLQHAPFAIGRDKEGRQLLCVDTASELVGDVGERFHDDHDQLAPAVKERFDALGRYEGARRATAAACEVLDRHGLVKPWQIVIKTDKGERPLQGLWCIAQAALKQLPAEALLEARDSGALMIAYCQLLSMPHLQTLGRLAHAAASAGAPGSTLAAGGEIDIEFLNQGGTLSLSGL